MPSVLAVPDPCWRLGVPSGPPPRAARSPACVPAAIPQVEAGCQLVETGCVPVPLCAELQGTLPWASDDSLVSVRTAVETAPAGPAERMLGSEALSLTG